MLIEERCSCGAVFKLAPGAAAGRAATTEEIDTAWEEVDRWRDRHAGHVPDHLAPPPTKGPDPTVVACVKRGGHFWPTDAVKGRETACYDTKNAAHLIRLLRMGIEFLRDGTMIVDRGGYDATELLDIKHGEWSLDQVKSEAARLFRRAEAAYDASTLPARPDPERVNALCVEIVELSLMASEPFEWRNA